MIKKQNNDKGEKQSQYTVWYKKLGIMISL